MTSRVEKFIEKKEPKHWLMRTAFLAFSNYAPLEAHAEFSLVLRM